MAPAGSPASPDACGELTACRDSRRAGRRPAGRRPAGRLGGRPRGSTGAANCPDRAAGECARAAPGTAAQGAARGSRRLELLLRGGDAKEGARGLEVRPAGAAGLDRRCHAARKARLDDDRVGSQLDELAGQTGLPFVTRGAAHDDDEPPGRGDRRGAPTPPTWALSAVGASPPARDRPGRGSARPAATFAGATSSITSGASTGLGLP